MMIFLSDIFTGTNWFTKYKYHNSGIGENVCESLIAYVVIPLRTKVLAFLEGSQR